MTRAKKVTIYKGIISSIDFDTGLVEVRNLLDNTSQTILPANLFDTDGNTIYFDELQPGDHVFINEMDNYVVMNVLKAI